MRFENIILDILRVLPKSLLKLIAGPPLIIDGNQLDLNIQVVEKLSQKETKQTRITTHDYREAAKRFEAVSYSTGFAGIASAVAPLYPSGPTAHTLSPDIFVGKAKIHKCS